MKALINLVSTVGQKRMTLSALIIGGLVVGWLLWLN
jgi:hypothetical protein